MSSPLLWTGVIGAALAVGAWGWLYKWLRDFHTQFGPLMDAGWDMSPPMFPRVLALVGFLGMLLTLACVIRAVQRRRRQSR